MLYFGFLAIIFIWVEFFPSSKEERIVLSKTVSDENESQSLSQKLHKINDILDGSTVFISNYEKILHSIIDDENLSEIENEHIELDQNETTYERVIFSGDLNASIKSFHDFWIVQYEEDRIDDIKILLHDKSATFPITIDIKRGKKWATIQTEHNGTVFKKWEFIDGQYREEK